MSLSEKSASFSRMFEDTASRNLPSQSFRVGLREKFIVITLLGLSTDISSAGVQTPSLFATAIGSSVTWQEQALNPPGFKEKGTHEARQKFSELKAKAFDPKTKKERIERALKLLSDVRPIEGIDKTMWKSIIEETALEDSYGD